ncbi:hypothetical protein BFP72_17530 [Reichenbachiella sp. 5M10]|uniref:hypothetical protein n=1 Tax=Reichenbachiella sp. 5M10 TaxID=1889772 RepID=UPI000C15CA93|nr:hypothetical protein [Reichenbachiella sp. 5M10]PIB37076.1 hypothetical protein BFP72_17530 [Reichenbachiella sp. 5M10]
MKSVVVYIGLLLVSQLGYSQAVELSGFGGYTLSGDAQYYDGEIDVKNGPVWGLTLGFDTGQDVLIQFIYSNTIAETEAIDYGAIFDGTEVFDIKMEHFHLGAEKAFAGNDLIRPYGAFSLGLTSYAPQSGTYDDVVRFSMGLGAGLKIFPTEKIGFKFQGKMYMPLVFNGGGIYCSSGSGCGGGSSFQVPIVHGEFSAGIVLRLEK